MPYRRGGGHSEVSLSVLALSGSDLGSFTSKGLRTVKTRNQDYLFTLVSILAYTFVYEHGGYLLLSLFHKTESVTIVKKRKSVLYLGTTR